LKKISEIWKDDPLIQRTAQLNGRSPPEALKAILLRRNIKENKLGLLGVGHRSG